MQKEIWKDVVGYEGLYQVSNLGNVFSIPKKWIAGKGGERSHGGKMISTYIDKKGYQIAVLFINKSRRKKQVHQLVAESFLNHISNGNKIIVDHINNNPSYNRVENLQIITQRLNSSKDKKGYSSEYVGVCWNRHRNKWRSSIRINGVKKELGLFKNEIEASKAYQKALLEINK